MHGEERGQVVPLAAALLVVAGVLALGLIRVASTAAEAGQAQAAADAAALAAVTGGRDAASAVATANDATVVDYVETDGIVTVAVRRRCCTARASASWSADGGSNDPTGGPAG